MENKKLYLLTWYGVDEWVAHGIVDDIKLAKEWEASGDSNSYEEFEPNKIPKPDRYRDNKLFPHAPDTSPPGTLARQMVAYYDHILVENLLMNSPFESGK